MEGDGEGGKEMVKGMAKVMVDILLIYQIIMCKEYNHPLDHLPDSLQDCLYMEEFGTIENESVCG